MFVTIEKSFLIRSVCFMSYTVNGYLLKRFLNAQVNNRIDLLSKAHDDHRADTNWLRNFVFGVTASFTIFIFLLLLTSCYLYRHIRASSRIHRSLTSDTSPASNSPTIHQVTHALTTILQRLDALERISNSISSLQPSSLYPFVPSLLSTSGYISAASNFNGLHFWWTHIWSPLSWTFSFLLLDGSYFLSRHHFIHLSNVSGLTIFFWWKMLQRGAHTIAYLSVLFVFVCFVRILSFLWLYNFFLIKLVHSILFFFWNQAFELESI